MTLSLDLVLQIGFYLLGLASLGGVVMTRLHYLEKKMDEHNKLIDRTYKLEKDVTQINDRISNLEKKG